MQAGEFKSRGIELDVTGAAWPGGRVTTGLGYADVKVACSVDPGVPVGARLANVPRVTASVWISQTLAAAWSLGFGVFHASRSRCPTMVSGSPRSPASTRR